MSKNKIFKKSMSAFVIAGILSSLTICGVMANWSTDSFSFGLDYSTGNPYAYSGAQSKDNDSSSYIYYENGNYSFNACIVGYDGSIREDIYLPQKTYYPGMSDTITNWVAENGIGQACLRGESNYDWSYNASGYWSADTN